MNTISPTGHVGVDVGKDHLDFFCHESTVHFPVPNTAVGIRQALRQLPPQEIACLVVEATGRYEQALVAAGRRGQAQEGGAGGLHAQNDRVAQRDGTGRDLLAGDENNGLEA